MIFIQDAADSILDRETCYLEVSGFSQSHQANPAVTTPSDHGHFSVFPMRHTSKTLPLRYKLRATDSTKDSVEKGQLNVPFTQDTYHQHQKHATRMDNLLCLLSELY
jgi:hypothetical protein